MERVKIKICDINDVNTARFCSDLKVDFLGLHQIYAPITAEKISLFDAIRAVTPNSKLVLVTRENDFTKLESICKSFAFDYIQLHFPTTIADIQEIKLRLKKNDCEAKLIAVIKSDEIEKINILEYSNEVDYVLFDTSYSGGTGKTITSNLIRKINTKCKEFDYFFAGGLNSKNIISILNEITPYAVDIQSGVEVEGQKHKKDLNKIKEFVDTIRKYNNEC